MTICWYTFITMSGSAGLDVRIVRASAGRSGRWPERQSVRNRRTEHSIHSGRHSLQDFTQIWIFSAHLWILSLFIIFNVSCWRAKHPSVVDWGVWNKSTRSWRTYGWVWFLNQLGFLSHIFFYGLPASLRRLVGGVGVEELMERSLSHKWRSWGPERWLPWWLLN